MKIFVWVSNVAVARRDQPDRALRERRKRVNVIDTTAGPFDADSVLAILRRAWSSTSSSQWRPDNPARGQCNVTAILLHDLYGAEILKTPLAAGEHFYNRIGNERIDLTASQFAGCLCGYP